MRKYIFWFFLGKVVVLEHPVSDDAAPTKRARASGTSGQQIGIDRGM